MSSGKPGSVMPDPATPFGERVARRLRDDIVIWLTVVDAHGTPQPAPVWFVWDGATFLIFSRDDARRNTHIRAHPQVALNFDGNGKGGDIIVITGEARIVEGDPPTHEVPAYVAKYGERMARLYPGQPLEAFSARYPVVIRVTPRRVRGF